MIPSPPVDLAERPRVVASDEGRVSSQPPRGSRRRWRLIRSAAALPCGVAVAIGYSLWQLVVEQKLFLHTLLVGRVSTRRVPRLPLGWGNVLQLKLVMLWQQLSGDPEALKGRQFEIYERVRRGLEARGVPPGQVAGVRE